MMLLLKLLNLDAQKILGVLPWLFVFFLISLFAFWLGRSCSSSISGDLVDQQVNAINERLDRAEAESAKIDTKIETMRSEIDAIQCEIEQSIFEREAAHNEIDQTTSIRDLGPMLYGRNR